MTWLFAYLFLLLPLGLVVGWYLRGVSLLQ
jgi:hypothetical protein